MRCNACLEAKSDFCIIATRIYGIDRLSGFLASSPSQFYCLFIQSNGWLLKFIVPWFHRSVLAVLSSNSMDSRRVIKGRFRYRETGYVHTFMLRVKIVIEIMIRSNNVNSRVWFRSEAVLYVATWAWTGWVIKGYTIQGLIVDNDQGCSCGGVFNDFNPTKSNWT